MLRLVNGRRLLSAKNGMGKSSLAVKSTHRVRMRSTGSLQPAEQEGSAFGSDASPWLLAACCSAAAVLATRDELTETSSAQCSASQHPEIAYHYHGKGLVRVVKVQRPTPHSSQHHSKHFTVEVNLFGPVEDCYVNGVNHSVVATDTQKNTVYILSQLYPMLSKVY
jgi:hypothetical protein